MIDDRGSVGLLGLVGAAAVVGAAVLTGAVVAATTSHARVDSAADMVALGSAAALLTEADPCSTAEDLAAANGVGLSDCRLDGLVVTVEVAQPTPALLRVVAPAVTASARAELRVDGDLSRATGQ